MTKLRFKFEKLIRDKIPDIMRQKNVNSFDYIMDQEEYIKELKLKLKEEAEEVIAANSKVDLIEELADILEVVYSLANAMDITLDQIEEARILKNEKNGGFASKIYSKYIEIDSDHKDVEYYTARPDKYPAI